MKITQNNQRLLDLVRYSRAELHEDGLISDQEYADLVEVGSISARRLEDYDEIKQSIIDLLKFVDFAIYDKKVDPGFFNIGIEKARARVKKS